MNNLHLPITQVKDNISHWGFKPMFHMGLQLHPLGQPCCSWHPFPERRISDCFSQILTSSETKLHLCKCHSSLESGWGLWCPVQINRMRLPLFRKTHLFSLAPVPLTFLLSCRRAAEDKWHWKKQWPPPWTGRMAPFIGTALGCQGYPGPRVRKWINSSQPSVMQAASVPFSGVVFRHVLSKTNEHLT